jgi:hypothetical protein
MKSKVTKTDVFVLKLGLIVAYIVIGSGIVGCCLIFLIIFISAMSNH